MTREEKLLEIKKMINDKVLVEDNTLEDDFNWFEWGLENDPSNFKKWVENYEIK